MRLSQKTHEFSKRAMSGEFGPEGVRFEVPTKQQPADFARRLQEQGATVKFYGSRFK